RPDRRRRGEYLRRKPARRDHPDLRRGTPGAGHRPHHRTPATGTADRDDLRPRRHRQRCRRTETRRDPSRDTDIPGAAHLHQSRTRGTRTGAGGSRSAARGRRPARRGLLPFAGGPDRQAVPCRTQRAYGTAIAPPAAAGRTGASAELPFDGPATHARPGRDRGQSARPFGKAARRRAYRCPGLAAGTAAARRPHPRRGGAPVIRAINIVLTVAVLVAAFWLYQIKYETAAIARKIEAQRMEIAREHDTIVLLRAEWSHLIQPKRLQELAGRHLEIVPMEAWQVVSPEAIAAHVPVLPPYRRPKDGDDPIAALLGDLQ